MKGYNGNLIYECIQFIQHSSLFIIKSSFKNYYATVSRHLLFPNNSFELNRSFVHVHLNIINCTFILCLSLKTVALFIGLI